MPIGHDTDPDTLSVEDELALYALLWSGTRDDFDPRWDAYDRARDRLEEEDGGVMNPEPRDVFSPRWRHGFGAVNELDIYSGAQRERRPADGAPDHVLMVDSERVSLPLSGWMRMGCVAWRWEYGACIELATIGMQVLGSFECHQHSDGDESLNFMNRRCLAMLVITARLKLNFSRAHMRLFDELRLLRAYPGVMIDQPHLSPSGTCARGWISRPDDARAQPGHALRGKLGDLLGVVAVDRPHRHQPAVHRAPPVKTLRELRKVARPENHRVPPGRGPQTGGIS